jgi:hypothetical protein
MARRRLPRSHGGSVKFIGSKPVNGDPCGTSLSIKECFPDGAALTTVKNDGNNMDLFYTVYKAARRASPRRSVCFGWEIRYDPAYATEAGGPCGTCTDPIYWSSVEARPGSFAGNPTTPLVTSTGTSPTTATLPTTTHAFRTRVADVGALSAHVGQLKVALS